MKVVSKLVLAVVALAGSGCATDKGSDREETEAVARETGRTLAKAGNVVATLQTTLAAGLDDSANAVGDRARARVEAAISALVDAAECVSLSWSNLTATVRFADCVIPTTAVRIDGALGVRIRLLDRSVDLTLNQLALGPDTFDGTVRAYVRGPLGALTMSVDADLTLANDSATLIVDGLVLDASAAGVTLSGNGAVTSPAVDATATADQLQWSFGDCLPSSGSVAFDTERVSGAIAFLATTPSTGVVELRAGQFPAFEVEMFPACP